MIDLIVRMSWTLLIAPLMPALVDLIPSLRARARRRPLRRPYSPAPVNDFTVLVPIYGDIKYLENVEYLSRYGNRVMLCTTTDQSDTFFATSTRSRQLTASVSKDSPWPLGAPATGARFPAPSGTGSYSKRPSWSKAPTSCVSTLTR